MSDPRDYCHIPEGDENHAAIASAVEDLINIRILLDDFRRAAAEAIKAYEIGVITNDWDQVSKAFDELRELIRPVDH